MIVRVLMFFFAILASSGAVACSCAPGHLGPREGIEAMLMTADAVTLATATIVVPVKRFDLLDYPDSELTQFRPLKVWKGNLGDFFQTQIVTVCCMCGVSFRPGETYLLYLWGPDREGHYATSLCMRPAVRRPVSREVQMRILDELRPAWEAHPSVDNP